MNVRGRRTHLPSPSNKGDCVRVFLSGRNYLNARIVMRQRKSYPKSFKTQVVQECEQPGVSVAANAMRDGINADVVRRWIPLYRDQQAVALPAFTP
ncbi:hypothetical protein CES87_30765 [Pseudomonas sp. ERMR1:02]|nr:hypothetical protein CES87_30765 [Pseudomonas sp. ERMR1:02]